MITATQFDKDWKTTSDKAARAVMSLTAILVGKRAPAYKTKTLAEFEELAAALDKLANEHSIL